eukprot:CAMPEP_0170579174 /NCGR_PEP_ID=MMETSP0224-20130122/5847_1 /TAXON_ID=285029 /ORGANISM="Togula jolla, Strain CCCM 725" /LENGTH=85 /DNA_ID=CAMNT_0010902189 /DNA_START=72 /DNA_END=329 /DNA_ORIENTATION=+
MVLMEGKIDGSLCRFLWRKGEDHEELPCTPQPFSIGVATQYCDFGACHDIDWQDPEPVADTGLVDADLVEPEGRIAAITKKEGVC